VPLVGLQLWWERWLYAAIRDLVGAPVRIAAGNWPGDLRNLKQAGLYGWWVDNAGADHLSDGLGHEVRTGRIYVGQTGATKWPSGMKPRTTLASRIGRDHLRGRIDGSTFRLTLASALVRPLGLVSTSPHHLDKRSEEDLTEWMREHLEVAVHPFADRDRLGKLEDHVLDKLDPPMNIEGMPPTPLREALTRRRREL
jgi:hypothetical protein